MANIKADINFKVGDRNPLEVFAYVLGTLINEGGSKQVKKLIQSNSTIWM